MDNDLILENQLVIMEALRELITDGRNIYERKNELDNQIDRTFKILEMKKTIRKISNDKFNIGMQELKRKIETE